MIVHFSRPGPPLSRLVDCIWLCEGDPPTHATERILAQVDVQLLINLADDPVSAYEDDPGRLRRVRGPAISGVHEEPFVIGTAQQATMMGVVFRPGGARPFLGVPVGELLGRHEPLDAIWGVSAAAELHDRLLDADTPAARFLAMERVLRGRLDRPAARHPAVNLALEEFRRSPSVGAVGEVADRAGLSRRRFIQVFRDEVGLAPKRFCLIERFQRVLALVEGGREVDWAGVALDCGYCDQAHLIRDFRAFAGLSPTAYLSHRGEHRNHVPLPG